MLQLNMDQSHSFYLALSKGHTANNIRTILKRNGLQYNLLTIEEESRDSMKIEFT